MAVNKKSFSEDFAVKKLNYRDDFLSLKNDVKVLDDCFTINTYEALKNLNSIKTSNYSNLMLSKKQRNSNWLETNTINDKKQKNLITTISFFTNKVDDEKVKGAWLYFDKNYEFWDAYTSAAQYKLTDGRPEKYYTNHIFYVDFIDEKYCTISHWFGDLKFYARVNEKLNFEFVTAKTDECNFIYHLNGEKLHLYTNINNTVYAVSCAKNTAGEWYITFIDTNSEDFDSESDASTIYVSNNILNLDFYTDASFISYDRSRYIDAIDKKRSAFNLETQTLFHHEYNKDDGVNFIPLKNNLTYKGHSTRGSNLTKSSLEYPDVDYRNYTAINTSKNQELGPENITLSYIFNDQDYTLKEGEAYTFTIPKIGDNDLLSPLYPYKYLNVNDTKFVKNGAFSSDSPAFADKIKNLQSYYTIAQVDECENATANNESYLITWLYKKGIGEEPIWLDRYYYPDKIKREDALNGKAHFVESFENQIDKNYDTDEIKNTIKEYTFIDKLSDMIIQPGNTYTYYRTSQKNIDEMLDNMSGNSVSTCLNNDNIGVGLFDYKRLNGQRYFKLDYKDFKRTNKLNVNFDIALNAYKKMGIQIFGCDHNHGFNIQNRKDLAPLHYYATEDEIFLLNDNFKIVRSFNLKEKYGEPIIKFILGEQFDDVIIISNSSLYILAYDLKLVSKINFNEDDIRIDAQSQSFAGLVDFLQYPFANTYRLFTQKEIDDGLSKDKYIFGEGSGNAVYDYNTDFSGDASILPNSGTLTRLPIVTELIINHEPFAFTFDCGKIKYESSSIVYFSSNAVEVSGGINSTQAPFYSELPINSGSVDWQWEESKKPFGEKDSEPAKYFYKKNVNDSEYAEVTYITGPLNHLYSTPVPSYSFVSGSVYAGKPYVNHVDVISNIAKLLTNYEGVVYNNNVYVPNGQYIIKLIFVPENDKDKETLGDKKLGIRILDNDEYYVNYLRETLDETESTETVTENGFIEVENKIKHVYIDKEGTIYGLNFDKFSAGPDRDTIYGLYANDDYINAGGYYWLFNQSLAKIKSSISTSKYAEFGSAQSIDFVCFDDADNLLLVRNSVKIDTDNTEPKRFEVYDRTKRLKFSRKLDEYTEILGVDSYRYFGDDLKEKRVFAVIGKKFSDIIGIELYDALNGKYESIETDLPPQCNKYFYQMINSALLMNYTNENKLYFNLYFPSGYIYNYKSQIIWDISDIQEGTYNINAEIDLDKAKFEIKINDITYETVGETEWFAPYVESNGTMFTDSYFIGCLGKKYGSTLNRILKRRVDPYMCKNTSINRMSIYTKTLTYAEYEAMRLKGRPLQELTLTIPCGMRSNIEEITRYFKYAYPGAISNKVKLNISGTGMETEGELQLLKREIEAVVAENKDCIVDIKEINFVK